MEESDGEETEGAQENARTFSWKRSKSRNIVRRLNPMRIECAKHEICKQLQNEGWLVINKIVLKFLLQSFCEVRMGRIWLCFYLLKLLYHIASLIIIEKYWLIVLL